MLSIVSSCAGAISWTQFSALQSLYSSLNGTGWAWLEPESNFGSKWNFTSKDNSSLLLRPCGQNWQGITCNYTDADAGGELCYVSQVTLEGYGLIGILPSNVSGLFPIETLVLSDNSLFGAIPAEIGLLSSLKSLDLSNNAFSDAIPSTFGLLTNLVTLDLDTNSLSGTIPTELGLLTKMGELYLDTNSLTGAIPTELGLLINMTNLVLNSNALTGTIPTELGLLINMIDLILTSNSLNGSIPTELGLLAKMVELDLGANSLTGAIPTEFGLLKNIVDLVLYANSLNGTIPTEFGSLAAIVSLELYSNSLSGTIPTELGLLTIMAELDLSVNFLIGAIPTELRSVTNMVYLVLYSNSLNGTIPTELGLLTKLAELVLGDNSITGTLPTELGSLNKMVYLILYSNSLNGTIPTELGLLVSMVELDFNNNSLFGTIPTELGLLTNMVYLTLNTNSLNGTVPTEFGSLANMVQLFFVVNSLSGSIPTEIGLLAKLVNLEMYYNSLTGTIPTEFGLLINMANLVLNSNSLTGTIPTELGLLTNIVNLILNSNCLTGNIPTEIGLLTASDAFISFDVSLNLLNGTLPEIMFGSNSSLVTLIVNSNSFTGTLSDLLFQSSALTSFIAGNNSLTGWLPQVVNGSNISSLDLSDNFLSGNIDIIGQLNTLEQMILFGNRFTGNIPQFSNLTELKLVFLNNNLLQGSIDSSFNATLQTQLSTIDISNNAITGTLPGAVFELPILESFAAINCCFHGSLPSLLCNAKHMKVLLLDGVASGPNCRSYYEGLFISQNAYKPLNGPVQGGVPSCLWSLSLLETLHLSSNGLTGSLIGIPTTLPPTLQDIVLSFNQLSGTIPTSLQSHNFTTLNLAGNRFGGTFSHLLNNTNSTVELSNNRLSGFMSSSFNAMENVNVMQGNLFNCDKSHPKPVMDPNQHSTSCGSSQLDDSLWFWLSCGGLIVVVVLSGGGYSYLMKCEVSSTFLTELLSVSTTVFFTMFQFSYNTVIQHDGSISTKVFFEGIVDVGKLIALLSSMVCTISVVVFCGLKLSAVQQLYSTHTYQYGYEISAVYLSGLLPAIVLLVIWIVSCSVVVVVIRRVWSRSSNVIQNLNTVASTSSTVDGRNSVVNSIINELSSDDFAGLVVPPRLSSPSVIYHAYEWRIVAIVLVLMVNVACILFANLAYLYILFSPHVTTTLKSFAQFMLSVFKMLWDIWFIPTCRDLMRKGTKTEQSAVDDSFTALQVVCAIFNFALAPVLMSLLVNSDCLLDLFVPESQVDEAFEYNLVSTKICPPIVFNQSNPNTENAEGLFPTQSHQFCYTIGSTQELVSEFSPAFAYSYQCSSSILISYIPVLIYSYVFQAFVVPVFHLICFVIIGLSVEWKATNEANMNCCWSYLEYFVVRIVGLSGQGIVRPMDTDATGEKLFAVANLVSSLMKSLAVMLVFGLASPPLAALILMSVAITVLLHVVFVQYYLNHSPRCRQPAAAINESADVSGGLDDVCVRRWQSLRYYCWMILYISSLFWGLMLFDMVGNTDVHNPRKAVWAPLTTVCSIFVFHCGTILVDRWQSLSWYFPSSTSSSTSSTANVSQNSHHNAVTTIKEDSVVFNPTMFHRNGPVNKDHRMKSDDAVEMS